MALAYDNSSQAFAGNGAGYSSWSHTCTGTNLILIVGIMEAHNTMGVTSLTYNGVSLTQIGNVTQGSSDTVSLWYLINPTTGTHTIAVSGTNTTSSIYNSAISYTGAKQSAQPDSFNSATTISSPLTISTTTVANGSWLVGMFGSADGGAGAMSAGTNTTSRQIYNNPGSSNFSSLMGDSNGAETPAGSFSLQCANSSGGLQNILGVVASIAPIPVLVFTQVDTNVSIDTTSLTLQTQSMIYTTNDTNVSIDSFGLSMANQWSPEIVVPTTVWIINYN